MTQQYHCRGVHGVLQRLWLNTRIIEIVNGDKFHFFRRSTFLGDGCEQGVAATVFAIAYCITYCLLYAKPPRSTYQCVCTMYIKIFMALRYFVAVTTSSILPPCGDVAIMNSLSFPSF